MINFAEKYRILLRIFLHRIFQLRRSYDETVADLFGWLKSRGEEYEAALKYENTVRVAINKEHVDDRSTSLAGATEIALFPPMTGG